jgi:SAM-dependent methyltransferase
MTDDMLALAEQNRREADVENARFLKGEIEALPLPDESVDVVISNCVINLSTDKDRVLAEAFRVLRPGGRFAVSDVVVDGPLPDPLRRDMEAYVGCVAGALEREEYLTKLNRAGFVDAQIEPTRRYSFGGTEEAVGCCGAPAEPGTQGGSCAGGGVLAAFIRARKPGTIGPR